MEREREKESIDYESLLQRLGRILFSLRMGHKYNPQDFQLVSYVETFDIFFI